jgi:hypothetical protein
MALTKALEEPLRASALPPPRLSAGSAPRRIWRLEVLIQLADSVSGGYAATGSTPSTLGQKAAPLSSVEGAAAVD